MIAYFDTSALLPLVVDEPASERAGRLWDDASRLVASRLVCVEARAALAMARRMGRLSAADLTAAKDDVDALVDHLDLAHVTERLVRRAGDLAEEQALRGYDAVHLATAEALTDTELVLVSGDRDLLRAAGRIGIATAATT